jgi:hypothetical protein
VVPLDREPLGDIHGDPAHGVDQVLEALQVDDRRVVDVESGDLAHHVPKGGQAGVRV